MGDITAANAVLTLSVPPLFPTPVRLQGFAADDIFDVPAVQSVETMMGVDGLLSGGFVFREVEQTIRLQADSPSVRIFDIWYLQQIATLATYTASALIRLPSISTKFAMTTGFLTLYKPIASARRVLQPREFRITWSRVAPSPT
jgi:hypothetical protein